MSNYNYFEDLPHGEWGDDGPESADELDRESNEGTKENVSNDQEEKHSQSNTNAQDPKSKISKRIKFKKRSS